MRIARVIGKLHMTQVMSEVKPGAYLLVRPYNRGSLAGKNTGNDEIVVMYDQLGAGEGDLVGLVEGAEATAPFYPEKIPYDAYNACILDDVVFNPVLDV